MENIKKSGVGIKDADAVVRVQGEFANLTRDCGFKIVLGTEGQSERLLMTLLNRILPMRGLLNCNIFHQNILELVKMMESRFSMSIARIELVLDS